MGNPIKYMLHKHDFPDLIKTPRTVERKTVLATFQQILKWPWEAFNYTDRKRKLDGTPLWWEHTANCCSW